MGMGEIVRAVFSTRESFFGYQVAKANVERSVNCREASMPYEEAIRGIDAMSGVISGYDDRDRAAAIIHFIDAHRLDGVPILVLHNGNDYLTAEYLNGYGYGIKKLSFDPLEGLGKYEKLAVLCPDERSENDAYFWLFAMETCEALGMESTLTNLASIDWAGIAWQRDLLRKADRDVAADLIRRYNESMARDVSKCMPRLERIVRGMGTDMGSGRCATWSSAFSGQGIYERTFPGGSSELSKRVFEKLNDEYERRSRFILILDNVYLPNQNVIKDGGSQVTLLLAGNDVGRYENNPSELTRKNVFVCLFRHDNYDSVERLAKYYFGSYRRVVGERGFSSGGSFMLRETSFSTSYREQEAERLPAEALLRLQEGRGFIHVPDGYEGMIHLSDRHI